MSHNTDCVWVTVCERECVCFGNCTGRMCGPSDAYSCWVHWVHLWWACGCLGSLIKLQYRVYIQHVCIQFTITHQLEHTNEQIFAKTSKGQAIQNDNLLVSNIYRFNQLKNIFLIVLLPILKSRKTQLVLSLLFRLPWKSIKCPCFCHTCPEHKVLSGRLVYSFVNNFHASLTVQTKHTHTHTPRQAAAAVSSTAGTQQHSPRTTTRK